MGTLRNSVSLSQAYQENPPEIGPCIRFLFPVEILRFQNPPKAPKLIGCPNTCEV